jgi:hypothetical protein
MVLNGTISLNSFETVVGSFPIEEATALKDLPSFDLVQLKFGLSMLSAFD